MTRRPHRPSRSPQVSASPADPSRADWRRGPWLPALIGCLCFLPALLNDFTYDDIPIVRDNVRIRSVADVPALWATDYWKPQPGAEVTLDKRRDRLYRPLTLTTSVPSVVTPPTIVSSAGLRLGTMIAYP